MNTLIDHPAQCQMLRDNPALAPSATEEILRWPSPVMYVRRSTMRDTERRGQRIMAGDKVGRGSL
jgi:cytochrome P450